VERAALVIAVFPDSKPRRGSVARTVLKYWNLLIKVRRVWAKVEISKVRDPGITSARNAEKWQ
jgi:hypothetical protein